MNIGLILNIVLDVWFASEVALLLFTYTRGRGQRSGARDRGSLLLLWPAIFAGITLGEMYGGSHPHTMLGGAQWLSYVGLGLLLAGLAIRWSAIVALGRSFSVNVAIHSNQKVKKDGLFRLVRHPSYSGMLLLLLGLGVATRNWIALAIVMIPPVLALLYRLHVEEGALRDAFGAEYVEYSASTRRLIPWIY